MRLSMSGLSACSAISDLLHHGRRATLRVPTAVHADTVHDRQSFSCIELHFSLCVSPVLCATCVCCRQFTEKADAHVLHGNLLCTRDHLLHGTRGWALQQPHADKLNIQLFADSMPTGGMLGSPSRSAVPNPSFSGSGLASVSRGCSGLTQFHLSNTSLPGALRPSTLHTGPSTWSPRLSRVSRVK